MLYNYVMESVLVIVIVVGLVVTNVVTLVLSYKERITMAKVNKAKDVGELEYILPSVDEEDEEVEGGTLVPLHDMPDIEK